MSSACDAAAEPDRDAAVMGVFAGKTLAIIDGFGGGVVLDAKQFPTRSVEEPDTSRVLRGSHDGFVENLMQNAALLRRRVRDTASAAGAIAAAGALAARTWPCATWRARRTEGLLRASCGKSWMHMDVAAPSP